MIIIIIIIIITDLGDSYAQYNSGPGEGGGGCFYDKRHTPQNIEHK